MNVNKGILATTLAYVMWGVLPLYWKLLERLPSGQILSHRIIWSVVFILLVLRYSGQIQDFRNALRHKPTRNAFIFNGFLVSSNWFIYIWAVNHGYIVQASLGYYINPLMSMVLGVVIFGEKLNRVQWLAVLIATAGVSVLTFGYGDFPWIALFLASTFGVYGLVKKRFPAASTVSLGIETLAVIPFALAYLGYTYIEGNLVVTTSPLIWVAIIGTGVVTALPLLLFGYGAQTIPFTLVGFLQFIAPTISLLLGVIVYDEIFTVYHLLAFSCIWFAISLFLWNSFVGMRRRALTAHISKTK